MGNKKNSNNKNNNNSHHPNFIELQNYEREMRQFRDRVVMPKNSHLKKQQIHQNHGVKGGYVGRGQQQQQQQRMDYGGSNKWPNNNIIGRRQQAQQQQQQLQQKSMPGVGGGRNGRQNNNDNEREESAINPSLLRNPPNGKSNQKARQKECKKMNIWGNHIQLEPKK